MSRPWQVWVTFAACLAVVLASVGWLSIKALEADQAEADAQRQAAQDENVRLALWRMDSQMTPLVTQESARPYFLYNSFYSVASSKSASAKGGAKTSVSAQTNPSPLMSEISPLVVLHFQFEAKGQVTSPQVPAGRYEEMAVPTYLSAEQYVDNKGRLDSLKKMLVPETLLAQLPPPEAAMTLPAIIEQNPAVNWNNSTNSFVQGAPNTANSSLPLNSSAPNQQAIVNSSQPSNPNISGITSQQRQEPIPQQDSPVQQMYGYQPQSLAQGSQRGQIEYENRRRSFAQSNVVAQNAGINTGDLSNSFGTAPGEVQMSMMTPVWLGTDLILARRVCIEDRNLVQGCLLNWPEIKTHLLAGVNDLLPEANLSPDSGADPSGAVWRLASLPVRLVPGPLPELVSTALSPVKLSLLVAWGTMLAAILAGAVLLRGVMALSERRAAFVSAVTHELRTPLTTFRMYAEMLSQGMVRDEGDRRSYLETLRIEADRLTHLVTNVLAYARLERGRPGGRIETISVEKLLDIATGRLADRAAQAGLTLAIESHDSVMHQMVLADPAIVEQILFNLVDNACKYASIAADKTLHLSAEIANGSASIRLRDHGPGVSSAGQRRLFQPFHKSANEAANSAPGVGLGLALSKRLAREMGGDLRYEANGQGACFALSLPIAG
jgi:signal transduction histidine kinase